MKRHFSFDPHNPLRGREEISHHSHSQKQTLELEEMVKISWSNPAFSEEESEAQKEGRTLLKPQNHSNSQNSPSCIKC